MAVRVLTRFSRGPKEIRRDPACDKGSRGYFFVNGRHLSVNGRHLR